MLLKSIGKPNGMVMLINGEHNQMTKNIHQTYVNYDQNEKQNRVSYWKDGVDGWGHS